MPAGSVSVQVAEIVGMRTLFSMRIFLSATCWMSVGNFFDRWRA
jgi:hypothetical protein